MTRWVWVSIVLLGGLVVVAMILSRTRDASPSRRAPPAEAHEEGPAVESRDSGPGQARPAEEGTGDAPPATCGPWLRFYELEKQESAALAPLLAERVRRLERLQNAGRVGGETVLLARIEEALGQVATAAEAERWQLLRSIDDWARDVKVQIDRLHEAGRLSVAERDEAARALTALRVGEQWLLSPRRQIAALKDRPAPGSPADTGKGVAEVRAQYLGRQVEVLEGATEPTLIVLRLLLRARIGEMSFEDARAEAERQREIVPVAAREEAEALVALFDWYGWARLRELNDGPR